MKLLITGATGLVGRRLVEELVKQGVEIHYLTTRKSQLEAIAKAKGFYWNLEEGKIDSNCFSGVQGIIHLAGATVSKRWTTAYKAQIYSSRILSTELLLKGLKELKGKHQIKHYITASAIGIYPSDFEIHMKEDAKVEPKSFMQNVVFDWEKISDVFQHEKLKVVKLRIGLVLSKTGGVLGTLKIPCSFGLGAAFGNGKQGQSWIHIDDLVGIFCKALSDQWEGVFNAVAPNPVTQSALMKALSRTLKRPYFLPPIPAFLLKLAAGEMSALVLESHWVSAQKIVAHKYVFKHQEINEAITDLLGKK
jgi:uncharacterized protein (TIGR01777 family)